MFSETERLGGSFYVIVYDIYSDIMKRQTWVCLVTFDKGSEQFRHQNHDRMHQIQALAFVDFIFV